MFYNQAMKELHYQKSSRASQAESNSGVLPHTTRLEIGASISRDEVLTSTHLSASRGSRGRIPTTGAVVGVMTLVPPSRAVFAASSSAVSHGQHGSNGRKSYE